jgi:mono/diheme cytochrome c family protein
MKTHWIITVVGAAAAVTLLAAEKKVDVSKLPPPSDKKGLTYAKDIKPLFEKSCIKCHGPEKAKGDLRVDSLEAALKGSEHGKVIEAGKSEKSRVVHSVARLDPDEAMPPEGKGDPWTKEQVALLRAWIDQGAK